MDLDEPAVAAARWAIKHVAPGSAVTLAHVVEPPPRPGFSDAILPPASEIEAVARDYAEAKLRAVASHRFGGEPKIEIRVGKPHEEIASIARDVAADLVVIGPHGKRPRPRTFLGTMAERIVRTCPVPVLVGTRPPRGSPRKLLVPVDDSAVTPKLLEWARSFAEQFDAEVELLHVWSNALYSHVASMSYATTPNDQRAEAEIQGELREAAQHWLAEMARTGIGLQRVHATATYGDAGERIVEAAASKGTDLILLGRRGAGLVAPALLGSTVATVLRGARRPVLVIPD